MAERKWGPHGQRQRTSASYWKNPLHWNANGPRFLHEHGHRHRVFCASLADVFDNKAPRAWRAELYELRDPGLLKLFCGSAPAAVAEAQLANHQRRLSRYNELLTDELPEGQRLSLEAGIGHEREYIRFWTRLTRNG